MKKIIAIFILTFMISGVLVGCVSVPELPEGDGQEVGNQEIGDGNTENGGENTDNGGDETVNGGENTDNDGDEVVNGGENTDNGGDEVVNGEENTDNDGDEVVNGGENTGNDTTIGDKENQEETDTDEGENNQMSTPEVGTEIGNLFRSITLERVEGGTVSPDDYRGKIVIVNIWATWCPPCKAELPDFDKIASEYADDVVIIAAHDYSGKENAPAYVESNFPDSKIIFAYDSYYGDAFYAAGGTKYVPRTAILDRNGVIIYMQDGLMTYEELVEIIDSQLTK